MLYHFIYETTNLINGKKYRGKHSTNNLDDGYLGSGVAIMRSIDKYGKDNFKREILEICKDIPHAYFLETLYVNPKWVERDDTYNLVPGGLGGYGAKHSEETKVRLAEAQRGKLASEATKAKMRVSSKGKENAIKAGKKISKALLGRSLSESHKQAVRDGLTGYKHTEEAKRNMSKCHIGVICSDEAKRKISESNKNVEKIRCPHCGKIGHPGAMTRWHFDNCKSK